VALNSIPQETTGNACVVKLVPPLVLFQPKLISFTFPFGLVGYDFICYIIEGTNSLYFPYSLAFNQLHIHYISFLKIKWWFAVYP
jgi:hypothetical protein